MSEDLEDEREQCELCGGDATMGWHKVTCPLRDDREKWALTEAEVDG